jgi:hypothetical protein
LSEVSTVAVTTPADLARLHELVRDADRDLIWLLGPGVRPLPGALEALLDARHVPAASLPVGTTGEPLESAVGRFVEHDPALLLDAARERRVPLRHAPVTSLLVRRETVLATAPPDPARFGGYAGDEWTGRVFALAPAMLVPASRVHVAPAPPGSALHALRAARAGGWGRGQTLRELARGVTG